MLAKFCWDCPVAELQPLGREAAVDLLPAQLSALPILWQTPYVGQGPTSSCSLQKDDCLASCTPTSHQIVTTAT